MLKLSCPRREQNFYIEAHPMPKMQEAGGLYGNVGSAAQGRQCGYSRA